MATLNNNNKKNSKAMIFFLGVITGLIIAIIVAFFVSRSPFSSKKAENQAPATPLTANNTSDPNQTLYGKNTPPSPQLANQQVAPSTAPVAPATAPANTIQNPQQNASAPAATNSINNQATTYLQVGAYKSRAEAETMRGKVALSGFQSFVTSSTSSLGTIYRVRLGPYQGNEYTAVQSKLKQNNIPSALTH